MPTAPATLDDLLASYDPGSAPSAAKPAIGNQAMAALNGQMNSSNALLAQERMEMAPALANINKTMAQPLPAPPESPKIQPPPQEAVGQDSQAWVMAMAAMAGLVGARGHTTAALNAFGAGVKGMQEGNKAAMDEAHKQWKESTELALDNAKITGENYKAVLDNRRLTMQEQFQEIKDIAASYHDAIMMQAADKKDMVLVAKIIESQQAAAAKAETATKALDAKVSAQLGILTDEQYEQFKSVPANETLADAYAKGVAPPELVRGVGTGAALKLAGIQRLAKERHPDLDIADATLKYSGKKSEVNAEGRTVGARAGAANIAIKEIDKLSAPLKTAMQGIDPKQFPTWNSLQNAVAAHTGGAEVVKANIAIQEFKTAFTNLMIRNGVPTDQARSKADALINVNMSLAQIDGVIEQAKISGAAVIDALNEAKGEIGDSSPPSGGGRISVNDPQGKPHTIDASELSEALQHGWTKR